MGQVSIQGNLIEMLEFAYCSYYISEDNLLWYFFLIRFSICFVQLLLEAKEMSVLPIMHHKLECAQDHYFKIPLAPAVIFLMSLVSSISQNINYIIKSFTPQ